MSGIGKLLIPLEQPQEKNMATLKEELRLLDIVWQKDYRYTDIYILPYN